jgi:hypothetical protein
LKENLLLMLITAVGSQQNKDSGHVMVFQLFTSCYCFMANFVKIAIVKEVYCQS